MLLALLLGAYAALLAVSFHRIASGVSKIKEGRFDTVIATKLMPPYMRAVAEDITCVRDGIQSAVNQALKDQNMKTELITNVTHDLKTPLTSIITYVDLLRKEGLGSENAGEYLNVIDEKSQKLKTLINDLVQASKASSGAMEVNLQNLDLCEFAMQITGEYKEELEKSGIAIVVNTPEIPVHVFADPSLVSRVFENLIGNIKKYAMQGTRAFLTVSADEKYGTIVFKNISASPLNIDSRRLTERFYRGDSSRTGEGSGLGLSIAKDLCTLQGGKFRIELDGDMFKVYVSFAKTDG
jgi:signal transduction histidine kinase